MAAETPEVSWPVSPGSSDQRAGFLSRNLPGTHATGVE